jgi:hypothetical protein
MKRINNGSYSVQRNGVFPANIGDNIQLANAAATAWNVLDGGQAEGMTRSTLAAQIAEGVTCSRVPVPVSSPRGLVLLLASLVGFVWLKRARSRAHAMTRSSTTQRANP